MKNYSLCSFHPNAEINKNRIVNISYVLLLADVVFMIRGYALANLIEASLICIFLLDKTLRNEFLRSLRDPAIFCLALFAIWVTLSAFWSKASFEYIVYDWLGWRKLLLVPFGFVLLNTERRALIALYLFVAMGVLYLSAAVINLMGLGELWDRPYYRVAQDANVQGLYFSLAGTTCLLLASLRERSKPINFLLISIGLIFFVLVIYFGISRSGYAAFIVCSAALASYFLRHRIAMIVLVVIFAVVLIASSPVSQQRVRQAVAELSVGFDSSGGAHTSGSIRAVMWSNTVAIISNNLILGVGAGSFQLEYADQVSSVNGWRGVKTDDPHNHYLHLAAEYGLIGLGLFTSFILVTLLRVRRYDWSACLLLSAIGACSAIALFNGVFGAFAMGRLSLIFITTMSMIHLFGSNPSSLKFNRVTD